MVYIASPLVNYYPRAAGNVLYLGIAKEILNLPYWYYCRIMAKEAAKPKKQSCRLINTTQR